MTVMVAEQAGKTAGKKVAARRASSKVAQGRVTSSSYDTYNTRARPRPQAGQRVRQAADDTARVRSAAPRPSGQGLGSARIPTGDRGYQPVILAEFLAAVVIVTLTPIATGGSPAAQAKNSPSPYDTGDLRQLVAIGGVYFVLALLSSGNSGRLAAWFGGLVLIALGMSKMAHGQLTAAFKSVSTPPAPDEGQTA
jgi:hypothetical protein